jgi:hypothetical protein
VITTPAVTLLVAHMAATSAMAGLIWFVQVVHYPLFRAVGDAEFAAYETDHQRRTAWVVGPFMAVEGVSALAIATTLRAEVGTLLPLAGLALLLVVHTSTVALQVPAHRALTAGSDGPTIRRLVATNWIRTAAWSSRCIVAASMIVVARP